MANGFFTYLRHADNKSIAATIAASSASGSYPVTNLNTLPVSKHWRSTGITSEDLQIDLGAIYSIDLMGIVNHNLTSAATVTINGGSTANPNGGQYTTTLTYRQFDAFKLLTSVQTWRYWKFIFVDTGNTDGYIKIGNLLLGDSTTLPFHWRNDGEFTDDYINILTRSPGGAVYAENVYGVISQKFQFGPLSVANMATLRTLYRGLRGSAAPIFIIPESLIYDGYFGRFVNAMSRRLSQYEYTELQFVEDGRGRDITA